MRSWLKNARLKKSMSQADVAQQLGVTRQAYNYIEKGERQVDLNLSIAAKLSDIFDIPLSAIRNYEEELLKGGE